MAAARPRLLVPGLVPRDPGRERHRVRRGAATAILLEPDDRLTVRDLDGGQRAELTVLGFGSDGFDGLGVAPDGDATILRSLVGSNEDGASEVVAAVAARGADPTRAKAAVLFGPVDAAGLGDDASGGAAAPRGRRGTGVGRGGHRRRRPRVRPRARDRPGEAARGARAASPGAARRPAARLPGRPRLGARVRGEGGASTSRSSTSRDASAPISSRSTPGSCRRAGSAGSTRPPRGR